MRDERPRLRASASGLDVLPPAGWWHEEELVRALTLSGDQLGQLDRIAARQDDEIARLERDGMVAMRDLRTSLDAMQPSSDDLTTAGRRVRELRATLLDRQVQLLADERLVLNQQQWRALQDQLQQQQQRRPAATRDRGGDPGGRRGRGGMGGGRRP